jgi:integrase
MKGHVRERGKGNWYAVLDVRDPATGKRRRKWHSLQAKGKREAQIECARLIHELKSGKYTEAAKDTVATFLDRWLEDVRTRVTPKTHERYAQIAHKNVVPLLGAIPLAKLKPEQISAAYSAALTSGRRNGKGGLSPATVRAMHALIKSALSQARIWRLIPRNPAADVKGPKPRRPALKTYDLEQTAEMIELTRGQRIFVPAMLAVLCGMRRGEIAALRWRNVELDAAQLAVTQSAEQTKAGVRYKEPKSGRGRTIALSTMLVAELKVLRLQQAEDYLKIGKRLSDDDFVVAQPDGSPLLPHSIGQEWVRFLGRTRNLPRIRFHDLRHAHATHLLAAGVHPKVASERLGHSKVGITLDLYSHVLPNMQADAAAIVDGALRAALNKRGPKG